MGEENFDPTAPKFLDPSFWNLNIGTGKSIMLYPNKLPTMSLPHYSCQQMGNKFFFSPKSGVDEIRRKAESSTALQRRRKKEGQNFVVTIHRTTVKASSRAKGNPTHLSPSKTSLTCDEAGRYIITCFTMTLSLLCESYKKYSKIQEDRYNGFSVRDASLRSCHVHSSESTWLCSS